MTSGAKKCSNEAKAAKNDDKGFSRWRKRERKKERKTGLRKKLSLAFSSNGPKRAFGWAQVVTFELVFYLAISKNSAFEPSSLKGMSFE